MNDDLALYADWYVWSKRNLSTDSAVCHAAAAAACEVSARGGPREEAIAAARRSVTTGGHLAVDAVDVRRRRYAEWFDWARRELGGVREQQHAAAAAALAALDAGRGANAAVASARAAYGLPPQAPGAPRPAPTPAPPAQPTSAQPPGDRPAPGWGLPGSIPGPDAGRGGYAGFWRRFAAYLVDQALLTVTLAVALFAVDFAISVYLITNNRPIDANAISDALALPTYAAAVLLGWLYYTLLEASPIQATIGKLALGLRVTDLAGSRIGWGRANARFWSKVLSGLPLGAGYLLAAFTSRRQALHDMVAGTLVVRR